MSAQQSRRNGPVRWRLHERIAWIELALDRSGGQVDFEAACALVEVAEEVEWTEGVTAVVLSSTGPHFCLGSSGEEEWPAPVAWVEAIANLSAPVIAAVHGAAVSEGCELALACDLRWVRPGSFFALGHLREGRMPRHGGTQRLARLVGRMRALELLWTGRRVTAREAVRLGLATRLFPAANWPTALRAAAREIASLAPLALRYAKEAVGKGADLPLSHGLRMEEDLYVLLQSTRDRREGIRAFLQQRRPRFRGA